MDFSSNQNVKNLIFTLNFSFLVQLGTLIRDIPSLSYSPETTQSPTTTLPKNVFCIDTPRNFTQNSDKSAILAIFDWGRRLFQAEEMSSETRNIGVPIPYFGPRLIYKL